MENLEFLIEYLQTENKEKIWIPETEEEKVNLWRSLVNVRMPKKISEKYLQKEDEFLKDYFKKCSITDIKEIETEKNSKIALYQGDITKLKCDAIINPANEQGLGCFIKGHSCLDNQITTFAGIRLRLEDNEKMKPLNYHLETGEAFITKGYNLPANYVIHTVGPIIQDKVEPLHRTQLKKCYRNSLELAQKKQIKTIAFPSISTGVFRFPKELASKIAIDTIKEYIEENKDAFDKVVLVAYTEEDFKIYQKYMEEKRI